MFETNNVPHEFRTAWESVSEGLPFLGQNLTLKNGVEPQMPEGLSKEILEETLLGREGEEKPMNPFLFIALNIKKVDARLMANNSTTARIIKDFARKKGFYFEQGSPKVDYILEGKYRIREGDTQDWIRKTGRGRTL